VKCGLRVPPKMTSVALAARTLVLRVEADICVVAPEAAGRLIAQTELQPQAVKPISRSQRNGGFGAHFGPSRGDPRTRASRPIEASKAMGEGMAAATPLGGTHASLGANCGSPCGSIRPPWERREDDHEIYFGRREAELGRALEIARAAGARPHGKRERAPEISRAGRFRRVS
jgi:hypothetical protein